MMHAKDEQSITRLFENVALAWNKGDGTLYASYFTEDCDYVTFRGEHLMGREQVAASHQKLFTGFLKGSQLFGRITSARYVTTDIMIVHHVGGVKLAFQRHVPEKRLSINSNILVRTDIGWMITSFHNCRIQREGWMSKLMKYFFD